MVDQDAADGSGVKNKPSSTVYGIPEKMQVLWANLPTASAALPRAAQTDLSNLRQLLQYWRFCYGIAPPQNAELLPLAVVIVLSMNDFVSRADLADLPVMLRHTFAINVDNGNHKVFVAKRMFSVNARSKYMSRTPFQQYRLSSAAIPWLWDAPDTLIMTLHVLDADWIEDATHRVKLSLPGKDYDDAVRRNRFGPLLLIFLCDGALLTTAHELLQCERNKKQEQGPPLRCETSGEGVDVVWNINQRTCAGHRQWASSRFIPFQDDFTVKLLRKILAIFDQALDSDQLLAGGTMLRRWDHVFDGLFPL